MESETVKCPYCGKEFPSYNCLTKHVISHKAHGDISREQLLCDAKYGGVRPLCKCGCGQETQISYQGGAHFRDYVCGHQSRIKNNWGHNELAKRKSAETRVKQYGNGERQQWNKGLKWADSYGEETIQKLQSILHSEERAKNISKALKGVPKSHEHVEKMRQYMLQDGVRKKYSTLMRERIENGGFQISSKEEAEFINEVVKPLGVEYVTQYYLRDLRHYCDVDVAEKNVIIEFQGDYWHANPKIYDIDKLSKQQSDRVAKDIKLREYCNERGIKLIEVWESDYRKDAASVKDAVKCQLLD